MTTYLHHGHTFGDAYMRHEIQEPVMDPVTFIDHGGRRILVAGASERSIFTPREDVLDEFFDRDDLGYRGIVDSGALPAHLIDAEIVLRALASLGIREVHVPGSFPIAVADHLRSGGIQVVPDPEAWDVRRRRKTPWEIEGMERAQRAAEAAMLVAARMLKESEPVGDGRLRFEGEILTAEYLREAMCDTLVRSGADPVAVMVQSGNACLRPLERGRGPVSAGETCIIDCFPRDMGTGAFTALTRTYVTGIPSDEVHSLHGACLQALRIALESIKPGADDVYRRVAGYFHDQGFPTQLHDGAEGSIGEGFIAPIGHGVGLDVRERPWMGERSDGLAFGDVVAIAPSLCFADLGGVRLCDVVLVTEDGPQHLSDPIDYDLEP